ncbi:putative ribosome biogenesis protein kri1 protein [Phaeoacremonium minimum UCRPA7]|uniref:Putative ribosome biogenesis protein kri1 protein n=1 Tax=Phaeoacremonium minimum (strain UCR-PA7) TaxID=1286976 RepID=R8BFJ3_PHAM7|nr:putative ribosome biogenesis protein kri1 protein [Phaeoacremonium minimum UCRPA7]EON98057.1 putative ribosome biogenesis protein kri1 protein [Phaeoacremonium minimum UCRPA7]
MARGVASSVASSTDKLDSLPQTKSKKAAKTEKRNLFEDESGSSSEEDLEDGGAKLENSGLKINQEFARRFEHNKKREEIHRLEEKFKSAKPNGKGQDDDEDDDSSEDETEDEEGFLATEELDAEISATLQAIKNRDPRIYDKDSTFYRAMTETDAGATKEKKEKPVFLHDYHRERYMKGDVGTDDVEMGDAAPKTHVQEQEDLRNAILSEINAGEGDDSEDDFIKPKVDPTAGSQDGVHPSRVQKITKKDVDVDVKLADKDPDLFLSNFMTSRAWVPEEGGKWQAFESDEGEDNDLADEVEIAYNLRFEDPEKSNEVLKSYSRKLVEARSVRREDPKGRKRQRELEKEKKEAEKAERAEERARLKRLKVEEAEEKLRKIKKAAGLSGKQLNDDEWMRLLEDAWDNDKWEEEMSRRFGDQYYAEAEQGVDESDAEDIGDKKKKKVKKPMWDDDIDIKDIIPDFEDKEERPEISLSDLDEDGQEQDDEAEDEGRPSKKRKTTADHKKERIASKRAARQERSKIEALVDAQLELDNPRALKSKDKDGAAPLFRYRETSPTTFGLTARDILMAPSDSALNEFVGLKKLATFRDVEKKRKDKKKLGKKARLRQWRREVFGQEFEHTGPTYGFEKLAGTVEATNDENPQEADAEQQPGVVDGQRKKKRKRSKGKKTAVQA